MSQSCNLISDERRPLMPQRNDRRCHVRALLLIFSNAFLRYGSFGIAVNLMFLLHRNPYSWSMVNAVLIIMLLHGFSYVTAPLGGWLSDAFLGRLNVAIIGSAMAFLATTLPFLYLEVWNGHHSQNKPSFLCTVTTLNDSDVWTTPFNQISKVLRQESCFSVVFSCVIFLGIGNSFVWSVLSPFLADQYPNATSRFRHKLFYWYYFALNIASFLSIMINPYIRIHINTFWGFAVPCLSNFISFLLLVMAMWAEIVVLKPTGSPITTVFGVFWQALRSFWRRRTKGERNRTTTTTSVRSLVVLDDAQPVGSIPSFDSTIEIKPGFFDYALNRLDGTFNEEEVIGVRCIVRVTIVLLCLIPYWMLSFQAQTTFLFQGFFMNLDVKRTQIPPSWLLLFHVLTVVSLIPLLHFVIFPNLERRGITLSIRRQLAVGLVFTTLAMVCAGVLEYYRMQFYWGFSNSSPKHPHGRHKQTIGKMTHPVSDLSIFAQIPQYFLIGVGEVFATVAALNMAITETPRSMHAIATACVAFSAGLGSFLGMALWHFVATSAFLIYDKKNEINARVPCPGHHKATCGQSHLDYFFFMLAGLGAFGTTLCLITIHFILPKSSPRRTSMSLSSSIQASMLTALDPET